MKEITIKLNSFQQIRELVSYASAVDHPVMVLEGSRRVNAKSIMCLFSLNLRKPITLQLDCGEADFEAFRQKVAHFGIGD